MLDPSTRESQTLSEQNQPPQDAGERIAKVLAHAGIASRREAERLIEAGRVSVNGKTLATPAVKVMPGDEVAVDGQPIGAKPATRVWRYHKPTGLLTTHHDPQGRDTVFSQLPNDLGRVISVGRLDLNSEGLLLLTNDGALARVLELPSTGWTRRYRVRAYGKANESELAKLADGTVVDGVVYGPVEVTVERRTGANVWLTVGIKEGKNREVRKVLASVGLTVNRLMRVAYGPFQLGALKTGEVGEVKLSILRDQLGKLYPLDSDGYPTTHTGAKQDGEAKPTGTAKAKPKKTWARNAPKTHTEKRKAAAKSNPKRADQSKASLKKDGPKKDGLQKDRSRKEGAKKGATKTQTGEFLTSKEGRNAHRRRRP